MHLQKLPDGSIRLSRLNHWDVQTFRSLPALADYSAAPEAEKRLLPTPAIESDLTPEMAMDWVEYVVPELREAFAEKLLGNFASLFGEFHAVRMSWKLNREFFVRVFGDLLLIRAGKHLAQQLSAVT